MGAGASAKRGAEALSAQTPPLIRPPTTEYIERYKGTISAERCLREGLGPIVFLYGLRGLPRTQAGDHPKVHVRMQLRTRSRQYGRSSTWPLRELSLEPVWNSARRLAFPHAPGDLYLHAELFEISTLGASVLLGSAEISLAVLGEADPTHVPVRLERGQERCSLLVRLAREPPRTKTIFFVRHGESVWNRAQAKLDVLALVSDVDHPLNLKGRVQAEALQSKMSQLVTLSHAEQPALDALDADAERRAREIVQRGAARRGDDASVSAAAATAAAAAMELERGAVAGALPPKPALPSPRGRSRPPGTTGGPAPLQPDLLTDAERALVNVQMIASSPLTRALQTCVIGLSPLLVRAGCRLRLMSNLREKKNLGGFDSSGSAVGAGVAKRLGETTRFLYQDSPGVASALLACAPIDSGEVADKWWSEIVESKAEVKSRTNELLWQLQFAPEERIALVGHSHFFREVFRHHLSPKFAAANRLLALRLANQKLSNCGVVAVTFDFGARDVAYVTLGEEAAAKLVAASGVIDGVELMLGTTLTGSMKASH